MRPALCNTGFDANGAVEVTRFRPERQRLIGFPGLFAKKRSHAQAVRQVKLRHGLQGAINCHGLFDKRLRFCSAPHPAQDVSDVAYRVGQVHLIVEAAVKLASGAVVGDRCLVVAKIARNPANLHINRGARLLRVGWGPGIKGVIEEFTRALAIIFGESGSATFKEGCGSQVIHAERLPWLLARTEERVYPAAESSITIAAMDYFLFKTEPGVYSFDDFLRDKETNWDGVTNPTAVKHLREMKPGTQWIFYHTGDERTAVGRGTVVTIDVSDPKVPIVKVKAGKRLKHPKTLVEIKAEPLFAKSPLVLIGRLSIVPLTEEQWDWFLA